MFEQAVKPRRLHKPVAEVDDEQRSARIVVLTDDPDRRVEIVPGCQLDSMRHDEGAYFFRDGNELIGMMVKGGTVEYRPDERTYVVRLADGRHQ